MLEHDHPHHPILACQRCKQPLRIDDSLVNLDPSNADLLVAPLLTEDRAQTAKTPHRQTSTQQPPKTLDPVSRRIIPSPSIRPSSPSSRSRPIHRDSLPPEAAESFVMLTRSQIGSPMTTPSSSEHTAVTSSNLAPSSSGEDNQQRNNNSLSHRLKVANRLFDIMSARSDIDHPMCQDCTDMLLDSLNRQLGDVSKERDCYIDFLKKVNSSTMNDEEQEDLKRNIAETTATEQAAIESLRETERQRDALKEELRALETESKELDTLEESYWQDFNAFQIKLQTFHNERDSVNLKYDHDARQLERLQKTNVYKDTFNISHEGHFGTINGFRLGRLPNQQVPWNEINAAWGQTLLLLYTMANKLKFTFKTYRLLPLGSYSRIEKIDGDKASYELYGSGDMLGRLFNRKFDMAMVAFLNCLEQLCDYAERQDPNLKFPYRINKEKGMIGDASIKPMLNQDETWTRALKYTLTNTKWILIFASSTGISPAAASVSLTTGSDGRLDSPRSESFGERVGEERGKRGSTGLVRVA